MVNVSLKNYEIWLSNLKLNEINLLLEYVNLKTNIAKYSFKNIYKDKMLIFLQFEYFKGLFFSN